jgi:hypothetical protein
LSEEFDIDFECLEREEREGVWVSVVVSHLHVTTSTHQLPFPFLRLSNFPKACSLLTSRAVPTPSPNSSTGSPNSTPGTNFSEEESECGGGIREERVEEAYEEDERGVEDKLEGSDILEVWPQARKGREETLSTQQ